MSEHTFHATGLTCGHCAGAVAEEIKALGGVTDVQVDVVKGGVSTITVSADAAPTAEQISAALDEAGNYPLA